MLSKLKKLKTDPILGLVSQFKKDRRPHKINLTVGEFIKNNKTYKFKCVKNIENTFNVDYKYLPISGCPTFIENSRKFIFNKSNNLLGFQTLSGTGSLWLANQILKLVGLNKIIIGNPTWANHHQLFDIKSTFNHNDLDELIHIIQKSHKKVFLFQTCCHNPTGIDYSVKEWNRIMLHIKENKHYVILDNAYQGLASGNPVLDNYASKLCNELDIPFIICSSYSKNFGLYNQRLGNLFTNFEVENLEDHVKRIIRSTYSNPPSFGTLIFNEIYTNHYSDWLKECNYLVNNISYKRYLLNEALMQNNINWNNIIGKNGLFYLTPLNKSQIDFLREEHGIYMVNNGRINIAGLTDDNIKYFVDKIKEL